MLTNTTAPGFPPIVLDGTFEGKEDGLEFGELGMRQEEEGRRWRWIGVEGKEKACLPPRVKLVKRLVEGVEVRAGVGMGCGKIKVCMLKTDKIEEGRRTGWEEWVRIWGPVLVGPIVWEMENYAKCCKMRE